MQSKQENIISRDCRVVKIKMIRSIPYVHYCNETHPLHVWNNEDAYLEKGVYSYKDKGAYLEKYLKNLSHLRSYTNTIQEKLPFIVFTFKNI